MITRRAPALAYDVRIDGRGMMLRAQEDGSDLVTRRMVELEEADQLDNLRARGMVLELRFTVIAADRVRRRDGKVDTFLTGAAIKRVLERATAKGGSTPTRFLFADGDVVDGSIHEYSPRLVRQWPTPAWDVSISVHAPIPVR